MSRILITGINGFVGSHLVDFVLENDFGEVFGTIRGKSTDLSNLLHVRDKIKLFECDITDYYRVSRIVNEVEPDIVFHLAAQSFVPASWHAPAETLNTNVNGSLNLFEAVRQSKVEPKIHIAGSSEEYGLVKEEEVPIKETNPLRPLSPYGVSKIAMDLLGYQYHQSYGMKIFRTRAFNHSGPRRGEVFVCSDWSKQIVEIEKNKKTPVLTVGNLEAKRDFTDVRDIVRAYWLVVEKGKAGEAYNICSGKALQMQEILDMLLSMTDAKVKVEQDPNKMRPSDVPILLGDHSKFSNQTGWQPKIPFKQTLEDLLNYWRERVK